MLVASANTNVVTQPYMQVSTMTLQSDSLLSAGILANVGTINGLRMNVTNNSTFDVTTTDSATIGRLKNFTTLTFLPGQNSVWV